MTLNKNPCLLFLFCLLQESGHYVIFTRTACILNFNPHMETGLAGISHNSNIMINPQNFRGTFFILFSSKQTAHFLSMAETNSPVSLHRCKQATHYVSKTIRN